MVLQDKHKKLASARAKARKGITTTKTASTPQPPSRNFPALSSQQHPQQGDNIVDSEGGSSDEEGEEVRRYSRARRAFRFALRQTLHTDARAALESNYDRYDIDSDPDEDDNEALAAREALRGALVCLSSFMCQSYNEYIEQEELQLAHVRQHQRARPTEMIEVDSAEQPREPLRVHGRSARSDKRALPTVEPRDTLKDHADMAQMIEQDRAMRGALTTMPSHEWALTAYRPTQSIRSLVHGCKSSWLNSQRSCRNRL